MTHPGSVRRWKHLFGTDGRTLILAMDHGAVFGQGPPLQQDTVTELVANGVDAVLTTLGLAVHLADALAPAGLILRIDGGRTDLSEASVRDTSTLLFSMEQALAFGADAVAVMCYPGFENERRSLRRLATVSAQGLAIGLPVMAEVVPYGFKGSDRWDSRTVARSVRIACELGSSFIKTVHPVSGSFADVTDASIAPVVALGGSRKLGDDDVVHLANAVVANGGAGLAIGRNLWGADDPTALTKRLAELIHHPS